MRFVTASGAGTKRNGEAVDAATTYFRCNQPSLPPTQFARHTLVPAPSFLALSKAQVLYTASEDEHEGRISLNDPMGEIHTVETGGQGAVHLALDMAENFIAVANYRGSRRGDDLSVAIFRLTKHRLGAMAASARHEGSGPDRERQSSPHSHCVMFSPDNRLFAAIDLGTDGFWLYHFDATSGAIRLSREVKLPPGCGPRHGVFHPSLPLAYLCGELDSTLMTLKYDSIAASAELIGTEAATAARHPGRNYPSGIAISPDGRYLMLANRGADTIATFWIDPESGIARWRDEVPCGGQFPRAIRLDRTGRVLAVANQKSGNVVLFERDFVSGRLTAMPGADVEVPSVMDVVFLDSDQ
jgi:6-phosphogluconolactonase